MTTSEATEITELGMVGTTRFSLALTDRPWELDIDTIAVSVGAGVGSLGHALREVYPDAAWNLIEYELIDAHHPRFFALSSTRPEHALLVNPGRSVATVASCPTIPCGWPPRKRSGPRWAAARESSVYRFSPPVS